MSDDKLAEFYLKLPSARDELDLGLSASTLKLSEHQSKFSNGPLTVNIKDNFRIYTQLCSTRLTHNGTVAPTPAILDLLQCTVHVRHREERLASRTYTVVLYLYV